MNQFADIIPVLVTLLVAWIKRHFDKKDIKSRIREHLIEQGIPASVIDEVINIVNGKGQGEEDSSGSGR